MVAIAVLVTALVAFVPLPAFKLPFFWFDIQSSNNSSAGSSPVYCAMLFSEKLFGWPVSFVHFLATSSCSVGIKFNPLGLLLNLIIYTGLIFWIKNRIYK